MNRYATTYADKRPHSRVTLPEMLSACFVQETRYDYQWCTAIKRLSVLAYALGGCLFLASLASRSPHGALQSALLLPALALISSGYIASESYRQRKRKQERLIERLKLHPGVVGPALTLMHEEQAGELLYVAAQVLKAHLPNLRDPCSLLPSQQASLCKLALGEEAELANAAVKALEYVGDETAIRALRTLLDRQRIAADLRAAAEQSLASVEARTRLQRQARTLLRSCETDSNQGLLRSTSINTEADDVQLLRTAE